MNLYALTLRSGRRDIGLVPFDPLHIDEVAIEQGNASPVNVNLKFRDLNCFGLGTADIKSVVGFERDPSKSKFEFIAHIDHISLVGHYEARGNILLLPITGNGAVNLTFGMLWSMIVIFVLHSPSLIESFHQWFTKWIDQVDANIKFITKVEVRNDKQHLRIADVLLNFDTTRWIFT